MAHQKALGNIYLNIVFRSFTKTVKVTFFTHQKIPCIRYAGFFTSLSFSPSRWRFIQSNGFNSILGNFKKTCEIQNNFEIHLLRWLNWITRSFNVVWTHEYIVAPFIVLLCISQFFPKDICVVSKLMLSNYIGQNIVLKMSWINVRQRLSLETPRSKKF